MLCSVLHTVCALDGTASLQSTSVGCVHACVYACIDVGVGGRELGKGITIREFELVTLESGTWGSIFAGASTASPKPPPPGV